MTSGLASFIEQPGIPIVTVTQLDGNRVRLRQRRFSPAGASPLHGSMDQTWNLPVVLRYPRDGGVREERVMLSQSEQTVSLPGVGDAAWIFTNADASGYFRWRLPPETNAWLAAHATGVLVPRERLGLIDNAHALLEAGELSGRDYLNVLTGLAGDRAAEVALAVASAIRGVRAAFLSMTDRELYARFCHSVLRPVLDRIGLRPQAGEPAEIGSLRTTLLEILGGEPADPTVITGAVGLSNEALRDPAAVDGEMAPTALRIAARHGDAALYNAIEQAYLSARDPNHHSMFLRALGGFADRSLQERALQFALLSRK